MCVCACAPRSWGNRTQTFTELMLQQYKKPMTSYSAFRHTRYRTRRISGVPGSAKRRFVTVAMMCWTPIHWPSTAQPCTGTKNSSRAIVTKRCSTSQRMLSVRLERAGVLWSLRRSLHSPSWHSILINYNHNVHCGNLATRKV